MCSVWEDYGSVVVQIMGDTPRVPLNTDSGEGLPQEVLELLTIRVHWLATLTDINRLEFQKEEERILAKSDELLTPPQKEQLRDADERLEYLLDEDTDILEGGRSLARAMIWKNLIECHRGGDNEKSK